MRIRGHLTEAVALTIAFGTAVMPASDLPAETAPEPTPVEAPAPAPDPDPAPDPAGVTPAPLPEHHCHEDEFQYVSVEGLRCIPVDDVTSDWELLGTGRVVVAPNAYDINPKG